MRKFVVLFIFLSIIFLLRFYIVGQAVYGDGIYYWAFTRSIYFDHDIHYENELSHEYSPQSNNKILIERNQQSKENYTRKGFIQNRYPIGSPIVWIFFFVITDILIKSLHLLNINLIRSGYSDLYQIIVGLGNIFIVVLGVSFLWRLLKKINTNEKLLLPTIITLIFATNLLYYTSIDVVNSHPLSFFLSSLTFYLWLKTQKNRSLKMWFFLGLLIGCLTLNRTQDVTFIIILFIDLLKFKNSRIQQIYRLNEGIKRFFFIMLGFIIGFIPQIIIWSIMYGTVWKSPYLSYQGAFDFFHPHIIEVLFDTKRGILFFSPLLLFLCGGFYFILKRNSRLFFSLFMSFFLQLYVIASWGGWHQGESYGIRMLISSMPIFGILLLYLLLELSKWIDYKKILSICSLFIILNIITILYFHVYIHEDTYIQGKLSRSSHIKEVIKNRFLFFIH